MSEKNKHIEKIEKIRKIDDVKDDEIMTVGQVAAYLKISEKIIIKLVKEGEVPAFKIGEHWRVKKNDLGNFIEALRQGKRV